MRRGWWIGIVLSGLALAGCGGATGTGGGDLQVTGTVQAPTGITGTVQAPTSTDLGKQTAFAKNSAGKKSLASAVAGDLTCQLYSLEGELLGNATTAADGTFSMTVDENTLRPVGTAVGTWSARVALHCANASGSIVVETFAALSVIEGVTTTASLGLVDSDSSQAVVAVREKLGCDWQTANCTVPTGIDPTCIFTAGRAAFRVAALTDTDARGLVAYVRAALQAVQVAGVLPATLGYASYADVAIALRNGTLTGSALDLLVATLDEYVDADAATIRTALTSAGSVLGAIDTIVQETVAGTAGTQLLDSGQTLCAQGTSDSDFMDATIRPLLASTDAASIAATYARDVSWQVIGDILNDAVEADTLASRAGTTDVLGNALAQMDAGDFLATVTADQVAEMIALLGGVMDGTDTTANSAGRTEFAQGWARFVTAAGLEQFFTNDVLDASELDYVNTIFVADAFDPDTFDYAVFEDTIDAFSFSDATAVCDALTDYDAKLACYNEIFGTIDYDTGTTDESTVAFAISSFSPADGATGVSALSPIVIQFSKALDTTTVSSTTVYVDVMSVSGHPMSSVSGALSVSSDGTAVTFTPDTSSSSGTATWRVTVDSTIQSAEQETLGTSQQVTFTVQ